MAQYDISKIWDGVSAQLFEGAGAGTDLGFTGDVSIGIERTYLDVKASQTGQQPLDRRLDSQIWRVAIDFKEVGQATYFKDWWLTGNPDNAGVIDLHPGSLGSSVPTKRIRVHPRIMGADTSKDFIFDALTFDRGPTKVLNGAGNHVHRIEFITLPLAADLPTIDLGKFNYVP